MFRVASSSIRPLLLFIPPIPKYLLGACIGSASIVKGTYALSAVNCYVLMPYWYLSTHTYLLFVA